MADRRTRLRLGGFVAVSLAGLAALVVLFGGTPRFFASRAKYTLLFPEAPGVGVGTPVRKSGVRIGEVTALDLDDATGEVKISVDLDRKFPPRTTDEAVIGRGLLSGDTTLDFVPRIDSAGNRVTPGELVPPGTAIPGVPPLSPGTLLRDASKALPNAQEDIARVVASIQRFEQAVPKVEKAVDEIAGLARGGREFVPELRTTNLKVQDLIGTNVNQPPDNPVTVRAALQQVIELLQAIRPAADDLRTLLRDNGPELTKTLQSVRRTSDSANDLLNPENRKAATETLKNAQAASADLIRTIRLAALLVDQAEKTVKELNARLVQSEAIFAGAGRVVANAEKATQPLAANAAQIVQGVDQTVKTLNAAAEQANKAITEIRGLTGGLAGGLTGGAGGGSVQKLLTDPTLFNNLNETVVNVNRITVRLDKVARDLEVFADKVARRPETLGVSGIVRPNTGLKEPPQNAAPQGPPLPLAPTPALPVAPGMVQPGPLTPIPPVPFGPSSAPPDPVTVYKPADPAGGLPPRRQ